MSCWLLLADQKSYGFDDLTRNKKAVWDGITGAPAQKHLRGFKKGDRAMVYHTAPDKAVVLPPEAKIQLKVSTTHEAMLSIDGQAELPLNSGDEVRVKLSPYVARFLRIRPRGYFYSYLESRLKGKK